MPDVNRNIERSSAIIYFVFIFAILGIGVLVTTNITRINPPPPGAEPTVANPLPTESRDEASIKLGTFEPLLPTTIPSQQANICSAATLTFDDEGASSSDSNIFIALDPPNGQLVGSTGDIRAWVSDEAGGGMPTSAGVDSSGRITKHSDPIIDKDSHGYPWEPAIYITLITPQNQNGPFSGDKENGGTPTFVTAVKGKVTSARDSPWLQIPTYSDPLPWRIGNRIGDGVHIAEFIWNVASLGLAPGTYRVQVAVHDGDSHLAVECTTIIIP